MKRNLLKFSMFIEQFYSQNSSKEWTPQGDVIQYDVMLCDVILRSPFAQWQSEKLKCLQTLFIILRAIEVMKIISSMVWNRDGCKLVPPLFSRRFNGRISRQIDFCTGSEFTRTSFRYLLLFIRKLQIYSDFEKWETSSNVTQWISVTINSIKRKYFIYKQAA